MELMRVLRLTFVASLRFPIALVLQSLNDLAATDRTHGSISEGMWSCFEKEIDAATKF